MRVRLKMMMMKNNVIKKISKLNDHTREVDSVIKCYYENVEHMPRLSDYPHAISPLSVVIDEALETLCE